MEKKRAVISTLRKQTSDVFEINRQIVSNMKTRLGPLAQSSSFAKGAISGAESKQPATISVLEPLTHCYVELADQMEKFMDLFEENPDAWTI